MPAEGAKVAVRNLRRDALAKYKELVKAKEMSEDDERKAGDQIQKLTDKYVASMDNVVKDKESEIMEI